MIKGLDALSTTFLANLERIQQRQARIQQQVSSGLRINAASDDPDAVVNLLELRSDVERASTVGVNLQRVQAEVDTAEATMQVAVKTLERVRVLATQAATWTAQNRTSSATEVRQLHDQLVALTQTVSEGRYVFGGDLDTTVLYTSDWSQPGGVQREATAANTRLIQDVNGTTFSAARSAHQIFDDASANVFEAVHTLGLALEADDRSAVEAAIPDITAVLEHVNRQLSFYGHTQQRVETSIELTQKTFLARKAELSSAQDTDIGAALVEFIMANVHQEAALSAHARLPRTTLFDFLG